MCTLTVTMAKRKMNNDDNDAEFCKDVKQMNRTNFMRNKIFYQRYTYTIT